MKRKILFLILLCIIFAASIGARYLYLSQTKKDGRLRIIASPSAQVLINGESKGSTPFESEIAEGEYMISLQPEKSTSASGSASWEGKVKVYKGSSTFVSRELGANELTSSGVILTVHKMDKKPEKKETGQIEVLTEPDGALVFLDDDEQGIAPVLLSEVAIGDHELSVVSPGFFRRSQKVLVLEGHRVSAHYKLAIDPSHKKVEKKTPEPTATASATPSLSTTPAATPKAGVTSTKKLSVTIKETDTGWLRVRSQPSISASESARVNPGTSFEVLEETSGWYKIMYQPGKEGWISSQYATKSSVQ